uniref:Integrase catalytic domain-containing protein n=1 Tax=Tanacetum cinerariifolium TaxID=118510 RepID=A0A6L2NFX5_TANCI|nr:hypothetical protein [Tanacetum cinerariifolium]
MNNLVRHNLVRGLPTKCFKNDHNYTACLKRKQHKASCKSKLVTFVTKPLHTLHMDLFGSTSGIKREFSNARTPQQKGVAARRNRSLIEAARTMLANAKLPVTFLAEAVNTACYIQNRVLVNKTHNKTPYELFNGTTPSIGFLKPFRCHVMILNTLDNLVKMWSSLRYIVLPNWVHEEHLESTLSQPQDTRNTDTPESSGNSNPTATSTNPPADQLEILTVETPIPTVSSPAPTICFTDSQEPSKSNGVEADVRYMETSITASPIPTLRIHRDHPKSQIISPVDTLIQTRNKSKEVGEQSFIATIHQKTDPALLSFYLFLCFLSQVEPKKIFDALQDPRVRPIGTKWVLKNKKDERGIVIKNKARLVDQGHKQEERIDYDEVFTPVARIKAIRLFLAYASFMGFTVYQMDVKISFLYGTINEEVYVMQPPGFQDPEYPARVYKVEKAMYGLHQAPKAWYGTLSKYLLSNGFQRVKRIFRYLKGHPKLGLWYPKDSPFDLVAFSDSDYGGATQDRKSTSGGCQFLGKWLTSWQCKKQTIVAHQPLRQNMLQLLAAVDKFCGFKISCLIIDLSTKPFDAGRFQYLVVCIGMVNP